MAGSHSQGISEANKHLFLSAAANIKAADIDQGLFGRRNHSMNHNHNHNLKDGYYRNNNTSSGINNISSSNNNNNNSTYNYDRQSSYNEYNGRATIIGNNNDSDRSGNYSAAGVRPPPHAGSDNVSSYSLYSSLSAIDSMLKQQQNQQHQHQRQQPYGGGGGIRSPPPASSNYDRMHIQNQNRSNTTTNNTTNSTITSSYSSGNKSNSNIGNSNSNSGSSSSRGGGGGGGNLRITDGKVSETSILSEQLTSQLDYNNALLRQIQALEVENLNFQREGQHQQELLKKLSLDYDELLQEHDQQRHKFSLAQNLTDTLAKQSKESRLEAVGFKQQAEMAMREVASLTAFIERISSDKDAMQRELLDSRSMIRELEEDFSEDTIEKTSKIQSLEYIIENHAADSRDLRNKIAHLEAEKLGLQSNLAILSSHVEEISNKFTKELRSKETIEKANNELKMSLDNLKMQYIDNDGRLQEALDKSNMYQNMSEKLNGQLQDCKSLLSTEKRNFSELESKYSSSLEARTKFTDEIEALKSELASKKDQLPEKSANLDRLMQNTKDEYERAIDELKQHSMRNINDLQKKLLIANESQRNAEEQYFNTHYELSELHELLQRLQQDHAAAQKEWGDEKLTLEKEIITLSSKIREHESGADQFNMSIVSENKIYEASIAKIKADHAAQVDGFIQVLVKIQSDIRIYKERAIGNTNSIKECNMTVELLKKKYNTAIETGKFEGQYYKDELRNVLKKFVDMRSNLLKEIEVTHSNIGGLAESVEEEQGRVFELEETISKLQVELSSLEDALLQSNYQSQEQDRKLKIVMDQNRSDKLQQDSKINKLHQALEHINIQNKNLLSSNFASQNIVTEISSKHNVERLAHEKHMAIRSQQLKEATEVKLRLSQENTQLLSKLNTLSTETTTSREKLEAAIREKALLKAELDQARAAHTDAFANVSSSSHQLHAQLQQNLEIVQAQKTDLAQENKQLKAIIQNNGITI